MESISKFLQGIEEQRRKTLATRMQPLVSYLDQAYRLKTAEEQNQRTLGIATSDALERAKQKGYGDDEIETFRQSLSGISDPGAVQGMFADFEQAAQAKRILAQNGITAEPGLSTPELVRLANESESTRTANKNYETKAKEQGVEGARIYEQQLQTGADPALAFGEANRQTSMNEYREKAAIQTENIKDRKGSGSGKSDKEIKQEKKEAVNSKVFTEVDPTGNKNQYVYWQGKDGTMLKRKVYVDSNGDVRWKEGRELVPLNSVMDAGSAFPNEHKETSPAIAYTQKAQKKVEKQKGKDNKLTGNSFVYFKGADGETKKAKVVSRNGKYYYADTKSGAVIEVPISQLLDLKDVSENERKKLVPIIVSNSAQASTAPKANTKPVKTADDFINKIGF